MSLEIKINELSELPEAGKMLLKYCDASKVFAFSGDLGAGKTTFIKILCNLLGVTDQVSSPTYSIVNEYAGEHKIYHFDLYRIKDIHELLDIGFEEYFDQKDVFIFVEWPEIGLEFIGNNEGDYNKVQIISDDEGRKVIIEKVYGSK